VRYLASICAGAGLMSGYATTQEDLSLPQACVEIDNREGAGRQSRIFLMGVETGTRAFVGEVGPGRTLRQCFRRSTYPERAYLVIERPANDSMDPALGQNQPRPIRSQAFLMEAWDLWTWEVATNRMIRTADGGRGRGGGS